ncbi:tensin [Drosophila elegans]|uniref:tensin n=1 Tax=Drosophila elegans TaxID=30023 RepID=UPI0007E692C2|nr:tensin [Drosophila elegans]
MRSPYEESAAAADHKYQYQYTAANNNNNYYKNYNVNGNGQANGNGNISGNGNGNGNGIPYHARENSLPFSYGIAKTSTPLRKTPTPTRSDSFLDFDFGKTNNGSSSSGSGVNGSTGDMIKPPTRLTSPLLVRKTLGSGVSPTSSTNTNTIANTYHYRSSSTTPTPIRDNFEQLLRERREKVYNEYRTIDRESGERGRVPPTPPQRQYYASDSYGNGLKNGNSSGNGLGNGALYRNTPPNGLSTKYNYDFEFNLNLDDAKPEPTPYTTRNIHFEDLRLDQDVPDGVVNRRAMERNYHTINSLETTHKRQQLEPLEQLGAVYGQNHMEETLTRTRRDLSASTSTSKSTSPLPALAPAPASPIYATSTKRVSNPNTNGQQQQMMTPSPTSRPETPAFPVTPRTPFGASSSSASSSPSTQLPAAESIYQTGPPRRQVPPALQPIEVSADSVRFARSSAKFWYKPNLTREDAIALLASAQPGTFLVRDSTTYKNSYGLVVRVAQPPAGSQELVRHFLIEPTKGGVHLKGCDDEPVFTSLSALVFEHSISQLALPCLLRLPDRDIVPPVRATTPAQQQLIAHGAATNVLWLYSCDTESLTGNEAIRKAIRLMYAQRPSPQPTEVHFKVSSQGITLTDNTRKKFFRKHYTADVISHCAIDPENRMWTSEGEADKKTIFAFVARRSHSSTDNQCHVFCDLSVSQPAAAIVSFANRTLPTEKLRNYVL